MTGLELWSYTFREASIRELARVAGLAGFDWITATPQQVMAEGISPAELRARALDCGVRFSVLDGLVSALPGTPLFGKPGEPGTRECLQMALELGAGTVNLVHIGGSPTPLDALTEAFASACRMAAGEGLSIAIEFLPGTGIPDMETALAIVRGADAPNGSICFDTWHFARGGGRFDELDAAALSHVGVLQLSDRTPDQDLVPYVPMRGRKLPGEGALPLVETLRGIFAARGEIPVGAEVLSDEMDALGPQAGARRLAESLRGLLLRV